METESIIPEILSAELTARIVRASRGIPQSSDDILSKPIRLAVPAAGIIAIVLFLDTNFTN